MTDQSKLQPSDKMGRLPQLTESLELDNLPDKLDDQTLEAVKAIASSCPPVVQADPQHVKKCLRVMLAVLPKRSLDEISGELFVAAYVKKLGELSNEHVGYIAEKAMEQCKWFPTISECLEMGADYARNDAPMQRYTKAQALILRHRRAINAEVSLEKGRQRFEEIRGALESGGNINYGWDEVRGLPSDIQQLGINKGVFVDDPDFGMITANDAERMTKRRPFKLFEPEKIDECQHDWADYNGDERCTKCLKIAIF